MPSTTFITDDRGKKISVVLPIKQYEHLLKDFFQKNIAAL